MDKKKEQKPVPTEEKNPSDPSQNNKQSEKELDEKLKETFPASDATAKY